MFKTIKGLFQDSMVYGVGEIAAKLIGFVLIPVYTRFLTPEEYGVMGVILVLPALLGDAVNLGIVAAYYRFYFDPDIEEQSIVTSTAFIFNYCTTLFVLTILSFLDGQVSTMFFGVSSYDGLFRVLFVTGILSNLNRFGLAILRVQRKTGRFVLVTVVRLVLNLSLNIYFVAELNLGVMGILLGQLVPEFLLFIFFLPVILRRSFKPAFSFRVLRNMLGFGIPLILVNLAAWLINSLPLTMLARLSSLTESGLFTMGQKFGGLIVALVVSPFMLGWSPIAYAQAKKPEATRFYARVFTYVVCICMFAVLGISVSVEDILQLIATPKYVPAANVVLPVAVGAMLYGLAVFFASMINIAKKTYYSTIIWVVAAGISLALNLLLIPRMGRTGTALAYMLAYAFIAVVGYWAVNKLLPLPLEVRRLAKVTIASASLLLLGLNIHIETIWLDLILKVSLTCALPFLLFPLGFYLPEEKERIQELLRNLKPSRIQGNR